MYGPEDIMLGEINWAKKGKYIMISNVYEIWKKQAKENKIKVHRYREEIDSCQRGRRGGMMKWVKGIKRYKLLVMKQISHGNIMYIMVTVVNNTVWHIWKLLRVKV